jgi:hypothetical protein
MNDNNNEEQIYTEEEIALREIIKESLRRKYPPFEDDSSPESGQPT